MGLMTLMDEFESCKCNYRQEVESDAIEMIVLLPLPPKVSRMFIFELLT